jgi:hypothetical protein
MKTRKFNLLFRLTILVMVVCGLATCNVSKKASNSKTSFKIPRKIVKAEDLPSQFREKEQPVYYVQLFPDEATKETNEEVAEAKTNDAVVAEAVEAEPKEAAVAPDETKEIEKHVNEVVKSLMQKSGKEVYYHIVSGSFQNKNNADRFASYLKNIGYGNTYVRFFDNGFNRVIVQRYIIEVEARQYLQGFRDDNPKYADAWLFYNKDFDEGPLAYIKR